MTRPLAGPQTLLRTLNVRAILEALAQQGAMTRSDLMRDTGLSRTAVTQVLRLLDGAGAVASAGVDRDTRGPAATRVTLHPRLGFAAAVHVDHQSAHVALIDPSGAMRAEQHAPFSSNSERVDVISELIRSCQKVVHGRAELAVVCVPGIVTASGSIRDEQGPDGGAFRTALADRLGCPVRIENDVNLAALAELGGGLGEEFSSFALLMVDAGIGAGIVIDGALHRGASGVAGEATYLPQTPLPIGAPVLNNAVVADLARANGRDPDEPIGVHLEAAADGEPQAMQMVAEMARRLTIVAGSIALILDPEVFVLGGAAVHPAFVAAVREVASVYADRIPMHFVPSSFGREAPLVGASNEASAALRATLFTRILSPADRNSR